MTLNDDNFNLFRSLSRIHYSFMSLCPVESKKEVKVLESI